MTKLHRENELGFALMWIGIYCVGMSVADNFSSAIGLEHSLSAGFVWIIGVFLFSWIRKNGLMKTYGLCSPRVPAKNFLYFLPLTLITLRNLWGGAAVNFGMAETLCFLVKMLGVGFLEEIIFRGFLFKALCRDHVKTAVIISSVTFGLGHIINLINGSGMTPAENLSQIIAAVLMGLLYVIIFDRGGSLIPCILSHGVFNSLSAFADPAASEMKTIALRAALCVLVTGYILILLKTLPKHPAEDAETLS